jgi:signal transduction histidine kinase
VPLRIRLALIFAAATAVVLAVGGLVFVNQLSSGVRRTTDSTLTTRAANIANALAEPGSRPVEVLEKSRAAPLPLGGSEAQIVDRNGKVLAASATSRTPMLRADVVRKARSGALHFTGGTDAPQRYIVVGLTHRGEPMSIVVRSDLQAGDEAIDRVERLFLLGGVPLVLLAGVAGWLIARAALRPVERMRSEVAAMTDDEVGPVLDLPRTRDEIAALTTTMNDLLERVRRARLRERRFVAEAGHELRTPLTILQGELELADRPGRSVDELRETLRVAQDEALRLGRLAEDLLLLARSDSNDMNLRRHQTDVAALVEQSVATRERHDATRAVAIEVHNEVNLTVDLDPDRFRQAVDNLIDNALRHAPSGSTIEVRIEQRGTDVACIVLDRGPGFALDFIERAMDRFAKPTSQHDGGAGLGLSIVQSIAIAHGGRAWVANRETGGAEAGLSVPAGRQRVEHPTERR